MEMADHVDHSADSGLESPREEGKEDGPEADPPPTGATLAADARSSLDIGKENEEYKDQCSRQPPSFDMPVHISSGGAEAPCGETRRASMLQISQGDATADRNKLYRQKWAGLPRHRTDCAAAL